MTYYADIITPVLLSSLIEEAVASSSHPNLFKVASVTPFIDLALKNDF